MNGFAYPIPTGRHIHCCHFSFLLGGASGWAAMARVPRTKESTRSMDTFSKCPGANSGQCQWHMSSQGGRKRRRGDDSWDHSKEDKQPYFIFMLTDQIVSLGWRQEWWSNPQQLEWHFKMQLRHTFFLKTNPFLLSWLAKSRIKHLAAVSLSDCLSYHSPPLLTLVRPGWVPC